MLPKVIKTTSSKLNKRKTTTSSYYLKNTNIIISKLITRNELSKHKSYEKYSQHSPINNNSSANISLKNSNYLQGIKQQNTQNKYQSNIKISNDDINISSKHLTNEPKTRNVSSNRVNDLLNFNGLFLKNCNKKQKNSKKIKKHSGSTKKLQYIENKKKIFKTLGNISSGSDSFQEIESIDEDSGLQKNNMIFNKNNNINKEKYKTQENDYKRHLTKPYKKTNYLDVINKDISNIKKSFTKINISPDSEDEIIINDNEFENSRHIRNENFHETKFPKLAVNPFSLEKSNNNISKNMIINLNSVTKYRKEHHIKTSTFETYNKSSTNPNTSSLSNSNIENLNNINLYNELLLTAKSGNKEKFMEILEKLFSLSKEPFNINYQDEKGNSALHYACDEGNLKIAEILLKANSDPNLKNYENETPLHFSANRGYFDISKLLIENDALLNVFDNKKNSPLHFVCKNNNIELVKYFLTKLPEADVKNEDNKTPIDLTNNKEIKKIIKNYLKTKENSYHKIKIHQTSDSKMKNMLENTKIGKSPKNENLHNTKTKHITISVNSTSNNKDNKDDKDDKDDKDNIDNNIDNSFKRSATNTIDYSIKNNFNLSFNKKNEPKNYIKNKNIIRITSNNRKQKNKKVSIQDLSTFNNNTNKSLNNVSVNILKKTKTLDQFSSSNNNNNNYTIGNYISNNTINKSLNNKIIKPNLEKKGQSGKDLHKLNILGFNLKQKNVISEPVDSYKKNINNTEENISSKNLKTILKDKDVRSTSRKKIVKRQKNTKKTEQKFSKNTEINENNVSKISQKNNLNPNLINSVNYSINKTIGGNLNAQLTLNSIEEERITPSNFICLAQLGKGSFGEVYLVQKINTKEKFAMKVLRKERIMGQNLLKYAMAERNVLSLSNHPFIVKLNYAFQTSTKLFLILDYCPGGDLAKHLFFEKRFEESRAKFYICELLLALENLHKRDIIFRDLKPDNVVLDEDGHCKLTDFGLSKEGVFDNYIAKSFCGSIAYLAPEMLKKQGHGKAVDWYLLGVLFYEMLVGITPYFTNSKEDIFYNIIYSELKIPNFISEKCRDLLSKLLEKNPEKRLGGGLKDAQEIKEHEYFKDVNWDLVYNKKIKPPFYNNYSNKTMKVYHKPREFVNEDHLNNTTNRQLKNILPGWSFINNNDEI